MTESFRPAWWLPGPHSMTMWGKFFRGRRPLPARTERLVTPDDDHLTLLRLDGEADAPVLLLLHGLEGTVNSHYVNGILRRAGAEGFTAILLCFRTCDGEMNRARRTYHSGETTDLEFVVRTLIADNPDRPIVLAGISLGGNVLLKWLGERGDELPRNVCAAVAISPPCDLAASSHRINQGFSRVYQWNFIRKLRRKGLAKLSDFPDVAGVDSVRRARTFREFDGAFTAPLHGFRDAADYYARSSSIGLLPRIRRPTLLLTAADDPLLPRAMTTEIIRQAAGNPWVTAEVHERGGHVGFVDGPPWRPGYYAERRTIGFLSAALSAQSAGQYASSALPARPA